MDYLHKFRSSVAAQVHSVASQVSQALPGNPVFREYTIGTQIGSAGPGLCWKIYRGTKNTTKQEVAIWLFEKKQAENWVRAKREELPELLKRGVSQLTRIRHPRILTVERALEESRDCYAFCTEPVYACLANCFGDLDNIPSPPKHLKNFELLDVERRHGIYQISDALAFLHNDTKMVHGNVSPASIIINTKGAWKLGGFDFCILGNNATPGKITFDVPTWSHNGISALCPDLDYVAPELANGSRCDTFADIFSLGVLAFATFNGGKPLLDSQGSFARHRDNLKTLTQSMAKLVATVPEPFREDVKMCLNEKLELRPDAIQFTKLSYFEHPLLKTLNCLEQRSAMDNTQKMQLFKGLPTILPQFPKRALLQKVFPHLASEFATTMLIPFILPSVFLIAEEATSEEFASSILPSLVTVFPVQVPYQISLLLLQRMKLLLEKMPTSAIKQHLLPLMYNSLAGDNPRIQELALSEVPNMVKFVDREQMRTRLLPKLLRLVLESRDLTIRVQAMVCLAKLLPHLEPWMVNDQLLPALPKINSKDPGVLMAVLGIYKMVHESDKFGINKDQCARSVLPFLISTSVEPSLNLQQFSQYMALVHKLIERVENEQRNCLEQLSASQEEQRRITDFAAILNAQSNGNKNGTSDVDLGDLAQILGGTANESPQKALDNFNGEIAGSSKGTLTLEEKRRIAAEQQQQNGGNDNNGNNQSISSSAHLAFDPFASIIPQQPAVSLQKKPTSSIVASSPFAQQQQQRPMSSYEKGHQQQQQLPMDLLSEFLPPPTSATASTASYQLAQSASFAAFPTLPQPNVSTNPIQKRAGTANNTRPSSASKDPFDSLDQLVMSAKAETSGQTHGRAVAGHGKKKDPFDDLLS